LYREIVVFFGKFLCLCHDKTRTDYIHEQKANYSISLLRKWKALMSEVRFVISISVHEVLCKDMERDKREKRQKIV